MLFRSSPGIIGCLCIGEEDLRETDARIDVLLLNFRTVVLEKILDSPLDCKEIQPVHPKGDQFWVFIGRTDVEVEAPILWPPDAKS